jgi:RNA polymerase sigma-70 factor (ECF subfamily)
MSPKDGCASIDAACSTQADDAHLACAIARAKAGDPEGVSLLYLRYRGLVRAVALGVLQDSEEAEDVSQIVFERLITRLDRYRAEGGSFEAWLTTVTRNAARDQLRRHRPTVSADVSEMATRLPPPGRLLPPPVQEALATIPPVQARVLVLRHVVGLTPGEIARALGRTESAVHNLRHRGARALRARLAGS